MIIDLGAENTDLIIAEGESIWMRSIPIGGNNFTEALVKAFKLNFEKAEELKRNAATSKYARQIFQAMRPIFADLVAEIQRSIGFYASVHRDSRIEQGAGAGRDVQAAGPAEVPPAEPAAGRASGSTASAARPPTDAQARRDLQREHPVAASARTAWRCRRWARAKITSSLLPQQIRREKMWKEKTKWFGAAAAVFVLGLSACRSARYFYEDYQLAQSKQQNDGEIRRAISEAQQLDSEYDSVANIGGPEREDHQHQRPAAVPRPVAQAARRTSTPPCPTPAPTSPAARSSGLRKSRATSAQAGRRALYLRLPLRPARRS